MIEEGPTVASFHYGWGWGVRGLSKLGVGTIINYYNLQYVCVCVCVCVYTHLVPTLVGLMNTCSNTNSNAHLPTQMYTYLTTNPCDTCTGILCYHMQSQLKPSDVVHSHRTGWRTCSSFETMIIQCNVCIAPAGMLYTCRLCTNCMLEQVVDTFT